MNRLLFVPGILNALLSLLSLAMLQGKADALVIPNGNLAVEGNTDNIFPLLIEGGMRHQQVYDDSQFGALASGGELITGMAFRPDSQFSDAFGPLTIDDLTINLSTTSAEPDSLSAVFADNVGADNTTVLFGSINISSADIPGPGDTRAYEIVINFDTPFLYDPAAGNLLLDILNEDPSNNLIGSAFDAEDSTDSTSRVFGDLGDPGAASGFISSLGLVTEFFFSSPPLPEPSTLSLVSLAYWAWPT